MKFKALMLAASALGACATAQPDAAIIHERALVIDTHQDVPLFMREFGLDFTARSTNPNIPTDLPRMEEGGVDAVFFALWTPGSEDHRAMRERAYEMARLSRCMIERNPTRLSLVDTREGIEQTVAAGRTAVVFGLEGGHILAGDLNELPPLRALGVRYMTLTHDVSHEWADAALGERRWGGLNDLGRAVVRELNDLGIVADLTHGSDETFMDTVAVSRAPVMISHGGVRALVDNPLNASDEMLDALGRNGGVISIIFFDPQVNPALTPEIMAEARQRVTTQFGGDPSKIWDAVFAIMEERGLPPATLSNAVDQIDYVARRIGVDHVAIGSDFLGGARLVGLEDISKMPALTAELLRRGYSARDVGKILGGNVLRVLAEAERVANRDRVAALSRPAARCD
ncbi:MAG: dipeptidase [Hyphomonadaceae bacterium]